MLHRELNGRGVNELCPKIVLVGDAGVGKTSLLNRATANEFDPMTPASIGAAFGTVDIDVPDTADQRGKRLSLQVWDTAGAEKYRSLSAFYLREAMGVLFVYDVARRGSFQALAQWIVSAREVVHPNSVYVIVGNKVDLPNRDIRSDEGREYASQESMIFFETSARTGEGVDLLFLGLAQAVLTRIRTGGAEMQLSRVTVADTDCVPKGSRRPCC